ncbi:MAG: ferritin family protein [Candidatus Omnitrophica bacterium]|nr:ferritin family protein [Candidatus Omnitrophota bacterium]
MDEHFSGCEIVEIGIQIEKNGKDFYSALSASTGDKRVKELFEYLAGEEEKHIAVFKKILDSSCNYEPAAAYPGEYFAYMNALASQYVFTRKGAGKEMAGKAGGYTEGIDMGIQFEKESILYYEGMKRIVPPQDMDVVDKLISEEKEHLKRLCEIKEVSENEECESV